MDTAASSFYIGTTLLNDVADFGMSGTVDDFQLYNRAVSAEEVTMLFENPGTTLVVDDGNEDRDNDGLPNEEELALGTDPDNPASDGDGMSDGAEVAAGSDPTDPASMFQIVGVTSSGEAALEIEWTSADGILYTVEGSPSLQADTWEAVDTVQAAGSTASLVIDLDAAERIRFFRVTAGN